MNPKLRRKATTVFANGSDVERGMEWPVDIALWVF